MDDKFLIHLEIAEKSYGLWIGYERFVSHGGFSTLDA